jgi:hypothetical protein
MENISSSVLYNKYVKATHSSDILKNKFDAMVIPGPKPIIEYQSEISRYGKE